MTNLANNARFNTDIGVLECFHDMYLLVIARNIDLAPRSVP